MAPTHLGLCQRPVIKIMLISWNYPRRSQPYFVSCSHLPRPPSPPPTYLYQWYKYSTQWYKYSTQWYKYLYQWYKYICPMRAPPYLPHPFVVQIYLVPPYPALSPPTSSWYKNICTRGTKIFVPVVQISRYLFSAGERNKLVPLFRLERGTQLAQKK